MRNIDIRQALDPLLKKLEEDKSIDVVEKIISELVGFLGVKVSDRFLLNVPRIDAELSRFMLAPGFGRQAAAYDIPNDHADLIDLKLFWIKKTTKTNLSWLIGITPNFEDSEANDYKNISIDFIFPESADRLIILISDKFKIRSLELKDHLSHTQFEIFSNWQNIHFDEHKDLQEAKALVHSKLWESFNFEPINRAFYLELVESFSLLVHHLEKTFGRKPAVMFTTRLIGRLLFLWFLKKKNYVNSESEYFDVGSANNQNEYYRSKLEKLFFEVLNREISERENGDQITPYLNGGLFDINQTDFYKDLNLTFPSGYFSALFQTLNKYNFTVDESSPEFQHVAIDPEMLGRIFESLLAEQIDDVSGVNKKKVTGAFYTPREIVSYMCEESLIQFLKSRVPDAPDRDLRLQELIRLPETIFRDQDQNKRRDWKPYAESIIGALSGSASKDPLTVLDPAVGSGAFPMGMLHLLVKVYGRLDTKYEKNLSLLKRDILSKSLYGVDIEQTAIEICRLRAWLSIIVDIPEGANVEPLPNLDFKFACANALIPLLEEHQGSLLTDYLLKDKLMAIRDQYFNTSNKKLKSKLQYDYSALNHSEDLFESPRTKQLKSYKPFAIDASSDFYDPGLHHGVNHFDLIIGNPPYVQIQKFSKQKIQRDLEAVGYKTFSKTGDLYCLFYERAISLLKRGGILAFITSNKWMRAGYGEKVRSLFLKHNPLLLIDLGPNVFENATVDTNILLLENSDNINDMSSVFLSDEWKSRNSLASFIEGNSSKVKNLSSGPWSITNSLEGEILDKVRLHGKLLIDWDAKFSFGVKTGLNEAFVIDLPTKDRLIAEHSSASELIRPIIRGRDISRYFYRNESLFVILTKFGSYKTLKKEYPSIYKYLLSYEVKLKERGQCLGTRAGKSQSSDYIGQHHWLELDNNPTDAFIDMFNQDKIVWGNISYNSAFALLDSGVYLLAPSILMTSDSVNLKYVLGCLNSSVFNWEFKRIGIFLGKAYEWKKVYVEQVHIPSITQKNAFLQDKIISKVESILEIKKVNPDSNIANLEDEINQLVYRLYDLNSQEIEFIENSIKTNV
jgi:hypothetical protein